MLASRSRDVTFYSDIAAPILPASLVIGFVVAIVACPANSDEKVSASYQITIGEHTLLLNDLWGRHDVALSLCGM